MKLMVGIVLLWFATVTCAAPRIYGGKEAPEGKYPYMVSLRNPNHYHFCGGSILNERWIITAASCVYGAGRQSVTVVAGTTQIQGGNEQLYQSEYVAFPKDFNIVTTNNDVGLIRVNRDIEFNDKVQPVALPKNEFYHAGDSVILTGWGGTELGSLFADNLQEIDLKLHEQQECKKEMKQIATITDSHICTLNESGKGLCHYDLGGPLVADGVLVGIVSFIQSYCSQDLGMPDVYTRVFSFLDWIASEQAKFETV